MEKPESMTDLRPLVDENCRSYEGLEEGGIIILDIAEL
jgi:hypothetical protein